MKKNYILICSVQAAPFIYFDLQCSSGPVYCVNPLRGGVRLPVCSWWTRRKRKGGRIFIPFLLRQLHSYCSNAIRAVSISNAQSNNSTFEHTHISRHSPGKAACFHTSYAGRPLLLAVARQGGGCSLLCTLSQGLDCLQHSQGEVNEKSEEL